MTRVEDRLAVLLRTTVPASHGVAFEDVARRVRRRRAVGWSLAAAGVTTAVVVVAAIAGTSGGDHPDKRTATPLVNLAGTVSWINNPAPLYQAPDAPPASPPASNARACTAADVVANLASGNGAGGHSVRYVQFRNASTSTCVLKGYPHLTASEPGHPTAVGTDGSFFLTPGTANMRPGEDSYLGVETDTYCPARPGGGPAGPLYHQLNITLPGGGTVTVSAQTSGFDVTCGLYLTRFFVEQPRQQPGQPAPHDPLSDLKVSLQVPPRVAAGSTLVYVADLTNPTGQPVSLSRCPGYIEVATAPTPLKESYALNCSPVGAIAAHAIARFEMRLHIPAQTPAGPLTFDWSLATPFTVTGRATVNVTSSGSAGVTVSGALRMTGGPAGASQPGVPGLVQFDEVATGQQYSARASTDGSFTIAIPPGEYTAVGTSPQFNEGSPPCRADGNVVVTASGLSGVVIACSRK